MRLLTPIRRLVSVLLLLLPFTPATAAEGPEMILHMLDYIRVDYPATVGSGQITDPNEYAEMQEFSAQVVSLTRALKPLPERSHLVDKAEQLRSAIEARRSPASVETMVRDFSQQLGSSYAVDVSPRLPPSISRGAALYGENCASCHGINGDGQGPQATRLNPAPINFHDMSRQRERSIWGLYSAITQGVEGTAMPAFSGMSREERWALAFYVAGIPFSDSQVAEGRALWNKTPVHGWVPDLATLVGLTPAETQQRFGDDGLPVLAYLRSNPDAVAGGRGALYTARELLAASLARYRDGQPQQAYQLALSAYLDGFELGEASLSSVAPALSKEIEQKMLGYREMLRDEAPLAQVEPHYNLLLAKLEQATTALRENTMSASMSFVSAYVILLREGLEAILLLAAIAAVLIKLGRRDTLPYLHAGWIGALLMGGATWAASTYLFTISGAGRELTEGLTALLACAVVLYVGFWLHDKTHANRWREFVDGKVRSALEGRTLWVLTFIAFLAVYREVFETVLFYQALWMQAEPGTEASLWGGILTATFSLLALGWIILRSSIRLPLKLVFRINAAILFILAVVFAGHGVAGLQEAGWLPIDLVAMPSLDLLGIYPTLETLGAQLLVVGLVSVIFLRQRRVSPA